MRKREYRPKARVLGSAMNETRGNPGRNGIFDGLLFLREEKIYLKRL